jgi:hypothetical protein
MWFGGGEIPCSFLPTAQGGANWISDGDASSRLREFGPSPYGMISNSLEIKAAHAQ